MNKITVRVVEKFISEKRQAGMPLGTLKKLVITFNQAMTYAVRHRIIDYNPVRDAERPRSQGQVEKPKFRVLGIEEIEALISAATDPMYRVLFRLAVASGARQGELLGLKWHDVDFENNQVEIKRTYNTGRWYLPKSKCS